jgi:hypothetical protein
MPLQATSGAASYDSFGGGVPFVPNYIEDVFSCFVYTGTSAARDIVNGIDLAGKGGLAWIKCRTVAESNSLFTTNLGANKTLLTNATDPQDTVGTDVFQAFNSDGFRVGNHGRTNESPRTYVSWTFRKQLKFFDVVTFTGTGTASQTISHNLGSRPGCIIIKRTDSASNWFVGHDYDANKVLYLNSDAGATNISWNGWVFDPTTFRTPSISGSPDVNVSGATYVAYLFASNAGGFGLTGTDSVIRCGSFNPDSYNYLVTNIGWEPQWLLVKKANAGSDWFLLDTMRGFTVNSVNDAVLRANLSDAESSFNLGSPESRGFGFEAGDSGTYIYIAIRRPMKVPTTGTSVFEPVAYSGNGTNNRLVPFNFPPDFNITKVRNSTQTALATDRLRASTSFAFHLETSSTASESGNAVRGYQQNGITVSTGGAVNESGFTYVSLGFRRATGFFDEACYTGTGSARTVAHNLAAVPELMIVKTRSAVNAWTVYANGVGNTKALFLNTTATPDTWDAYWNDTTPTSSVFTVGTGSNTNQSGVTYVAYLFASAPGVSKVGSYTGNGSSQTINCGFTGGARFVMIKRTSGSGDWYFWDTARGIVSGNDPHLSLNTETAEVTSNDTIDTNSTGFVVNQVAATNVNVSSATYIFMAVA